MLNLITSLALITVSGSDAVPSSSRWLSVNTEATSTLYVNTQSSRNGNSQILWLRLLLQKTDKDGARIVDQQESFDCGSMDSRPIRYIRYDDKGGVIDQATDEMHVWMSLISPQTGPRVHAVVCRPKD